MAEKDSLSWLGLIVLEQSGAHEPKNVNVISLFWPSHANGENDFWQNPRVGQLFDENEAARAKLSRAKQIEIKGGLDVSECSRK